MKPMYFNLRLLITVLTSVGLLIPATACASCACCQHSSGDSQAESSSCCTKKAATEVTDATGQCNKCCSTKRSSQSSDGVQTPDPCGLLCECCVHSAPVPPANYPSPKIDGLQQQFAALATPSTLPAVGDLHQSYSTSGPQPLVSTLRIHALCNVWLN